MNLINRIQEYIAREELLPHKARVIVGLSGGADSVALLAVLVRLGYDCVACHCNFMLRGEESIRDRNHAESIAQELNVPYVETIFDTNDYAREHGLSIEMAARELRYEWFERMRVEHDAHAIAVAHHRDDNVETLLLNLVRGTGLAGVTGMKPRNGYIVRPLLCVARHELEQYLADVSLHYVTDSTNLESIYTRNKIRLDIMPLLREINPAVDACMERSIEYLRESEMFYRAAIRQWQQQVCVQRDNEMYVDMRLLHTSPAPRTLMYEIMSPLGFSAEQVTDVMKPGLSGRQFLSDTHRAITHREHLIIHPLCVEQQNDILAVWERNDVASHCGITLEWCGIDNFEIIKENHVACIDADKIAYPLMLRRWRKGDTFIPFGMKGRKKVSDYFSDRKYSLVDKEKALLLCDSEKILWIVGERSSNEVRITHSTTSVLIVRTQK